MNMISVIPMARKSLCLVAVSCLLAAVAADPRHIPDSHSPFGFAADADTIVGVEESTFSCEGLEYGYYADQSLQCKGFHICVPNTSPTGRQREAYKFSFFCPNQTRFSQDSRTCIASDQAYPCNSAHLLYGLNSAIGQSGDEVDKESTPREKSSGFSSPDGASADAVRKSDSISFSNQRPIRPKISNLAVQGRVRLDDHVPETVGLSKDGVAAVTSSRFKIDHPKKLDDVSSSAESDHSHTLSGSSDLDNDGDFILTTPGPSNLRLKVNNSNQNTNKRLKGLSLNDNAGQINGNANEPTDNKQIQRATEQRNSAAATRVLENSQSVPRGRKVSGGSEGIIVSVNSLNSLKHDGDETVAEPEPEPTSKAESKEHTKDDEGISSKSNNAHDGEIFSTNVQSSSQRTSSTPAKVTPHKITGANTPLLVGPRPTLSLQAGSIPRTPAPLSDQKPAKHVGAPTAGNDLNGENQQSPDKAVPSFQDHQKPPQNVLGNIQGNFHQIGFQIIKHDQSTDLKREHDSLVLSPLAKAKKIPSSLSLASFEPFSQQISTNSKQNLTVSSDKTGRGPSSVKTNNAFYTNRQSPIGQSNLDFEVTSTISPSGRLSNNRRGHRLYEGDSVTSRNPQAFGVTSANSNLGKQSSASDQNAYSPQTVSPLGETSPRNTASFRVSGKTAPRLSNDEGAGKRKINVNSNNEQHAVPPPPLFENREGNIKIFEAQPQFNENGKKDEFPSSKQNAPLLPATVSSNKNYLPAQNSDHSTQPSGKIPGFSAGVRRIKGKLIDSSTSPRTEQPTHKLVQKSQKVSQKPTTRSPVTVTSEQVTENVYQTSKATQEARTTAPTFNRVLGRGRGSSLTLSQVTDVDTLKINASTERTREEVTTTSTTAPTLSSRGSAARANRGRNQSPSAGRPDNHRTTTLHNSPVQTATNVRPASRNLRARGNHNSLPSSNQLKRKQFEPSKGHEVKTTHDLEILLDEDLDAATASLLAGIQPPQKPRHKKDSSSNEAHALTSASDSEVTVNDLKTQLGVKLPPITGTVIPQRLFNPRQNTPSNRRATPGSINLGTVGSVTTTSRNGEVNINLLPTTTTTTTTPRPRTTRLPRSTTEKATTTLRPVNDKRGSVKFTPSPYLDLSWLGPTIRNRITSHFKKGAASARGSQNSEISNAISDPVTKVESDNNFNAINSRRGSFSAGFSLSKSNKISHVNTRQQTSTTPVFKSPIPEDDLEVADTTTKAPDFASFSNRRRTRNNRVKLRVNPVNEEAEINDAIAPSENLETEELLEKQGEIHGGVVDDESKSSVLSSEARIIDEIAPNVINAKQDLFPSTTDTTKNLEDPVEHVDNSTPELGSRKLVPEDPLSTAENLLDGSSKNGLASQSVKTTTPKGPESVTSAGVKNDEIDGRTAQTQTPLLSRVRDIPKVITTPNLSSSGSDNTTVNTPTNGEKEAESLSNAQSRARNSKRRKVVRLSKRPSSIADGSSTSNETLPGGTTALAEDPPIQISKRKPTEKISQKFKHANNFKLGFGHTTEGGKKSEEPALDGNHNGTVTEKSDNVLKESVTLEKNVGETFSNVRSNKRLKIPLLSERNTVPETLQPVEEKSSSVNPPKKFASRESARRINPPQVRTNDTARVDALQAEKPASIPGTRSRVSSRVRQTLPKAQDPNNSSLALPTTTEKPKNLETSNVPIVHRLRSRRISTRRRLITIVPTTTVATNEDIRRESTNNNKETNSTRRGDSVSPKTVVEESSTEGTTLSTSKSTVDGRAFRTRFTTAIPESVKEVEKLATDDISFSKPASTTEIPPASLARNERRRRLRTKVSNSAIESPKKSEHSESLEEPTLTSRPTSEDSLTVTNSPNENKRRFRTRVVATKPDSLTVPQKSENNSLDKSTVVQTNSSSDNRRGFRRASRRRLITNKVSTDDNNHEADEVKEMSGKADDPEAQEGEKEVQQQDGIKNSNKSKANESESENRTTTFPSVTTSTTTTVSPVNFANLFQINTANQELEDEIQTISESQNNRKTAVRRRRINSVGVAENKTTEYTGSAVNEKDTQNFEESSFNMDDEQNSVATNENTEHSGSTSFRRSATKIQVEDPDAQTLVIQESKERSFRNKITSSKRKIQSELERSAIRPHRESQGRNRRLVKKVKLSKSEVQSDSLNNVYETLRSARSNTTVKSNELSIPGLEPGLKLRVVGTSVKKSVSTSSAAESSPEEQGGLSKNSKGGESSEFSDSSQRGPTKTERKFASRRPFTRKAGFSEELSVPQAAESRAFRTTIVRRKLNDKS